MRSLKLSILSAAALLISAGVFAEPVIERPVNAVVRAIGALGQSGARATGVRSLISLAAMPQDQVPLRALVPVLETMTPAQMGSLVALLDRPENGYILSQELAAHFRQAEAEAESRIEGARQALKKGIPLDKAQIEDLTDPAYEPFLSDQAKEVVAALREARRRALADKTASALELARKALGLAGQTAEDASWDLGQARSDLSAYLPVKAARLDGLLSGAERRDPSAFWAAANGALGSFSKGLRGSLKDRARAPIGPWAYKKLDAYAIQTVRLENLVANLKLSQGISGGLLLGKGSKDGIEADRLVPERLRREIEGTRSLGRAKELGLRALAQAQWSKIDEEKFYPADSDVLERLRRAYARLLSFAASNPDPHHLDSVKAELHGTAESSLPSIPRLRALWDKSIADAGLVRFLKSGPRTFAFVQAFPAVIFGHAGLFLQSESRMEGHYIVLLAAALGTLGFFTLLYRLLRNGFVNFGKMGGRWQDMLELVSGKQREVPERISASGLGWPTALLETFIGFSLTFSIAAIAVVLAAILFGDFGNGAALAIVLGVQAAALLVLEAIEGIVPRHGKGFGESV